MFTGDSSYACAYLALGNRSSADAQLALAFDHSEGGGETGCVGGASLDAPLPPWQ